ncbi:hypothetical protein [Bacillus cereus]|uniref:hypothetical protein n=1 Tax=Bacillus cereus TaxID=1396 RepID=UPI000BED3D2D|nr:hypothetical protein [Bacillus cereus]PDY83600.1 hypothetical protein CON06_08050 [Bacillus cereus]PFH80429.1 hypothetical protein COI61_03790 [Bacillus cereus]
MNWFSIIPAIITGTVAIIVMYVNNRSQKNRWEFDYKFQREKWLGDFFLKQKLEVLTELRAAFLDVRMVADKLTKRLELFNTAISSLNEELQNEKRNEQKAELIELYLKEEIEEKIKLLSKSLITSEAYLYDEEFAKIKASVDLLIFYLNAVKSQTTALNLQHEYNVLSQEHKKNIDEVNQVLKQNIFPKQLVDMSKQLF